MWHGTIELTTHRRDAMKQYLLKNARAKAIKALDDKSKLEIARDHHMADEKVQARAEAAAAAVASENDSEDDNRDGQDSVSDHSAVEDSICERVRKRRRR
jgi:peptidoglycan hydrolase CwlO-like protein